MNKDHGKNEVFEITDHTNSTQFEEFIYSIEQVIDTWGINQGRKWNNPDVPEFNRSESLVYNSQSFRLTHSTIHTTNDFKPLQQANFPAKTHCLNRWYGLSEFLILSPETTEDAIYFLDSSKLLMSSLACAMTRTQCSIPIFIQLGSPSKRFYSGVWLNDSVQTNFEMVLLKSAPPQCASLKEILCFFKRSIPCSILPFPTTHLSVRYLFSLNNFIGSLRDEHVYPQSSDALSMLPFGTIRDPIQDLLLATTWTGFSEHLISDSATGELDPLKATKWSLRCTSTSNPFCMLFNYVDYMMSLLTNESTLVQLLGTSADDNIEVEMSGAFRNLTGSSSPLLHIPSLDITMLPGKLLGSYGTFIHNDLLAEYLNFIFTKPFDEGAETTTHSSLIKTCPKDSITFRIVVAMCMVLCNHGGLKGFAQLWRCIVERLRQHFESARPIPGVSCVPDTSYSLFHQKLQMLNACISQKIERESALYTSTEGHDQSHDENLHPTLALLLTGDSMRIPVTQSHPPMTEDMQEEHVKVLSSLGSGAEGSRLRAELHSIALMSDMQAFKAANSNCRLEDFIRWYSPRDWISVPITKPVIPETTNITADAVNEHDDIENTPVCESKLAAYDQKSDNITENQSTESGDGNSDSEGNTSASIEDIDIEVEVENTCEDIRATDNQSTSSEVPSVESGNGEKEEVHQTRHDTVNEVIAEEPLKSDDMTTDNPPVTSMDIDCISTKENQLTESVERPMDNIVPEDEITESATLDDDEDEFVDAEDNFFGENSEFNSASDGSILNTHPNKSPQSESATKDDEFPMTNVPDIDTPMSEMEHKQVLGNHVDKPKANASDDQPDMKMCFANSIKYEQPLDPVVYGGHLSARMAKESVWKEAWYHAKPIPIWHQKRLFDDTTEAEKILHQFTHSTIKDIAVSLVPTLLHAAYERILSCSESNEGFIKEHINKIYSKLKDLHRYDKNDIEYFKEIVSDIYTVEITLSKFKSLQTKLDSTGNNPHPESAKKLSELEKRTRRMNRGPRLSSNNQPHPMEQINETELLAKLLNSEIELPGAVKSCWGSTLQRLFHAQQMSVAEKHESTTPHRHVPIFPNPVGREYILQTVTRHPSAVSRECPQRMFVTISGTEFRMAYANSSDKSFV